MEIQVKAYRKFFKPRETRCKCGCGMDMQTIAIQQLHQLRVLHNKPLIINSGARCARYNKKVGGSTGSYHKSGLAVDIRCGCKLCRFASLFRVYRKAHLYRLLYLAKHHKIFRGIGLYPNFIHCDLRSNFKLFTGE